jgi:hypothetical protein
LFDSSNRKIDQKHIKTLNEIQNSEGVTATTKLTDRHIKFTKNKMNVRLAAQTLSQSVSKGLRFAKSCNLLHESEDVEGNATFCEYCNDIFDLLNRPSRYRNNKLSHPYKMAIEEQNIHKLNSFEGRMETYISGLKDKNGLPLIQNTQKTGFVGFLICLWKGF